MTVIRAFAAYRPPPAEALRVACPPRDGLDLGAAHALIRGNPASFLRVAWPEVDRAPGDEPYELGALSFKELVRRGFLVEDREPHLYVYAQKRGNHRQVGVVACVKVDDYVSGRIKRHEEPIEGEVRDRAHHIMELRAHAEPALLTYRADDRIDELVAEGMCASPLYDFTTADGVEHRAWALDTASTRALSSRFAAYDARREAVSELHLLDGYDIAAGAVQARQKLQGSRGGEDDVFLAVLVPHNQVKVHPCHRLVRDRRIRSPEVLLDQLRAALVVEPVDGWVAATPRAPDCFGLYLAGRWYRARLGKSTSVDRDPVESLAAYLCHTEILSPIFGTRFSSYNPGVEFVAGTKGIGEVERGVDGGKFTLGIHLFPMGIEQILAAGAAGRLLPPRSASFGPRPWSGLFVHTF